MTSNEKMEAVIELAREAMNNGELPIAAAIYCGNELISSAHTTERVDGRWLVHAEQKALMEADMKKLPMKTRRNLELYTNLEPCLMCLGMALSSFIGKIYYSVEAPDDGAIEFVKNEYENRTVAGLSAWRFPEVNYGLLRKQSIQLFCEFVEQNEGQPGVDFARSIAILH
ncbi:MAG: nucleoside deaminase [Defluviitaleaceae bacterium]|nr:nucleoside deaminase [Defluviitaleaceae bacterium]